MTLPADTSLSGSAPASSVLAVRRSTPASIGFSSAASASARLARKRSASRSSKSRIGTAGTAAGGGLEVQIDRDREATHVADLHVEDDEVGVLPTDRVAHVVPVLDLDDSLTGPDERGAHLVSYPACFGGDEDLRHRRRLARVHLHHRRGRTAEEQPADGLEGLEIVDVAGQVRHVAHGGEAEALAHTGDVAQLALGDLDEVGEVRVQRVQAGGSRVHLRIVRLRHSGQRGGPRPKASGRSVPKRGWTRFTTRAATPMPCSLSSFGEELDLLHRITARRRDEHEPGRVVGEQILHACARDPEARLHTLERAEERDDVVDDLGAHDARHRSEEGL